jgi:hypothetical protein
VNVGYVGPYLNNILRCGLEQAQGIGYVQEFLARLENQTITVSDTSVNATIDSDLSTFPLGQPFYLDMWASYRSI